MDKSFESVAKIAGGVGLLLIGVAMFYYLVIYIPRNNKDNAIRSEFAEHSKYCELELDQEYALVDALSKNATPEQAKIIAYRVGIADMNGNIFSADELIKKCVADREASGYFSNTILSGD